MAVEHCDECGFDGAAWSDDSAMEAIGRLGDRWSEVTAGLTVEDFQRRPIAEMWSIVEYVDHVREVLFAMRFVIDAAIADPGVDLGTGFDQAFTDTPRLIDPATALGGVRSEADALRERLRQLPEGSWDVTAVVGADVVDSHWVCRHAVHDAHHHLGDVHRLRDALAD